MFYLLSIGVPSIFLVLNYFITQLKDFNQIILQSAIWSIVYGFLMCFLEVNDFVQIGWVGYSVCFFAIPIAIICGGIKISRIFKAKRKRR